MATYKAVPLFGEVYIDKSETIALTHIVDVDSKPFAALCKRPKSASLVDDSCTWEEPETATCTHCVKKLTRVKSE